MSKTRKAIETNRIKNQTLQSINDVIETVSAVDILSKDILYKQGFKDCLGLFKIGLRRIK